MVRDERLLPRDKVVLWVHVWSARMSVRLQSGHFSAEKVVTCSATKPYLKGCFVLDGALCSRCRPRSSAPLELGKSASTRPLLHEARISRGDMCMQAELRRLIGRAELAHLELAQQARLERAAVRLMHLYVCSYLNMHCVLSPKNVTWSFPSP